ncbi:unnamed protein product, partial [Candidula unifasciata]
KYAVFQSEKSTLMFYSSKSFPWPLNHGVPPSDEPECGYTGAHCSNQANSRVIGGVSGFFTVAAVLGGAMAFILF